MSNDADIILRALAIARGEPAHVVPLAPHDELADELAALDAAEHAAMRELAALDADAARLDLFEFVMQGWHVLEPMELEPNWHHEALCRNVQGMLEEWLARRDDKLFEMRWHKLVINICPSSLKSRIIMVFAVAWMWLRCPSWSTLCVSANPANVTRDAEACRDLVTSSWYRETFGITWTIRNDIDSKAKFVTTAGGVRISRGMTSKITGIHVDGILIDDPDDAHDVYSDAARRERSSKLEAISSRLNDKRHFVMIVTQQRVHVDDCTGDVLNRGGWLHANYPLEYNAALRRDTPFFTDPRSVEGESLHDLRFTAKVVEEARRELGSQGFESQYNGNPAPREGGMFKRAWFKYCRITDEPISLVSRPQGSHAGAAVTLEKRIDGSLDVDAIVITVDATFGSTSDTASAVGLLVCAVKGVDRFVLADITKPMTFNDTKRAIRALADHWRPSHILIEKKANGAAVVEDLTLEFPGVIALEVEGGKESRAAAMSPQVEAGNVYVLEGAAWLDAFFAELCVFPHGKRDDRVDALSQLMAYFREALASQRLAAKNAAMRGLLANARR